MPSSTRLFLSSSVCATLALAVLIGSGQPAVAADPATPKRVGGLSPDESLKHFRVPPGFEVKLFASEPEIRQPLSMTFDRRGRMWVIQYLQYPNPAGLKIVEVDRYLRTVYDRVPEPPPRGPRGVDRITILEDTDGDGRADRSKDFITGLNLTTGLALGYGGVFVVQAPYLLFYADRNGDDVPDGDPEVLLTGFGLEDAHALANSLQWGPDGWLYGAQGSTVTAHIRGITFQQGIWRYHPPTKRFELFAEGGGNTWGADFDAHGNMIAGTNYGRQAMLHQVQGAYYIKNFGKHGELQNPYAFGYFEHLPYKDFKGGHVTIGGIIYQADAFPPAFRNQYLAANVLSNALYRHVLVPDGSSFRNYFGGDLVTTDDTWFRPVDCTQGPDGSLFFADWYDQRANHVDPKDDWDKSNGRIYKLEYRGTKPVTGLDLNRKSSAEMVAMLSDRNEWFVRQARGILAERRDSSIVPALRENIFHARDPQLQLESLWSLYVTTGLDEPLALELLDHPQADVRTWTVRLLGDEGRASKTLADRLAKLARNEKSPTVRSQLASTAKRLPAAECLPIVRALVTHDEDTRDPQIPLLIWWAVEDKAGGDRNAVLDLVTDQAVWNRPLVHEYLIERLARRYAAAGQPADFASCGRLLSAALDAPTPASSAEGPKQLASLPLVVRGMEKGLEGRRLESVPQPLEKPLARLWQQGKPSIELVRLAVRLGSDEALEQSLKIAADAKLPAAERLAMIDLQGQVGRPAAAGVLLKIALSKEPSSIRKASIVALQRFNDPAIAQSLLSAYSHLPTELCAPVKTLLVSRVASARLLVDAVDDGRIKPDQISPDFLQQIAAHHDRELDKLVEKHWGKVQQATPAEKRARVHGIIVSMRLAPGDPVHGRELFMKTCGICHTLFGEGNKVGPDLTGLERKNTDSLLTNIIDPSAVIRKEFIMYTALLADGRVLNGLIADSTPNTVTLLDAKNQRTLVARTDIESLEPAAVSLMPDRVLDPLNQQDIRDLMSYLTLDKPPAAGSSRQASR